MAKQEGWCCECGSIDSAAGLTGAPNCLRCGRTMRAAYPMKTEELAAIAQMSRAVDTAFAALIAPGKIRFGDPSIPTPPAGETRVAELTREVAALEARVERQAETFGETFGEIARVVGHPFDKNQTLAPLLARLKELAGWEWSVDAKQKIAQQEAALADYRNRVDYEKADAMRMRDMCGGQEHNLREAYRTIGELTAENDRLKRGRGR